MERQIKTVGERFTKIFAMDEVGRGNASHRYIITTGHQDNRDIETVARVNFQEGPVQENGVNGCHQEDLLAIVLDRLYGFQGGAFKCCENAIAITKIEEALLWLGKRTKDRIDRGVEGTSTL